MAMRADQMHSDWQRKPNVHKDTLTGRRQVRAVRGLSQLVETHAILKEWFILEVIINTTN